MGGRGDRGRRTGENQRDLGYKVISEALQYLLIQNTHHKAPYLEVLFSETQQRKTKILGLLISVIPAHPQWEKHKGKMIEIISAVYAYENKLGIKIDFQKTKKNRPGP
jgi:hypothetical protein